MQLSEDTLSVLDFLHEAVEGGLRKRNDVGVLLELGALTGDADLFNTITTTGTAVWKVYGTLRRQTPGAEGYRQLEQEFGLQLNALREQLAEMMHHADDETLKRFDDIYFGMSQGVIRNLVDLGHDLARIKDLQRKA
jgi:hypothetical protein